ncbi:transposase [Colletotrichum tofieldiae]|nr:transposase [Colletotrichum tofieldiae]
MAYYIEAEDSDSAVTYLQESLSVTDLAYSRADNDLNKRFRAQSQFPCRFMLIDMLNSQGRVEEAAELKANLLKSAFLSEMRKEDLKELNPDGVPQDS